MRVYNLSAGCLPFSAAVSTLISLSALLLLLSNTDDVTGLSLTPVLRNGSTMNIRWQDVMVGDVVRVNSKEEFPADLLFLSSRYVCMDGC